jgi:hypothetical protein
MSEPTLDQALEAAKALEGWGFFEHRHDPERGDAEAKARTERGERVAANLARLYGVDASFREALDYLLDTTLRRATFTAQLGLDPLQAYSFGVFREGQNSFAVALLKLIAIGKKEPARQEERNP